MPPTCTDDKFGTHNAARQAAQQRSKKRTILRREPCPGRAKLAL
jgi:hypothetical protein